MVNSWSEEALCGIIKSLADAGFADRILLSTDVGSRSDLAALGGRGYGYLLSYFVLRLRNGGVSDEIIRRLLVANPRRVLEAAV